MRFLGIICCLLLLNPVADAKPKVFVSDEGTAIKIARVELARIYGRKQIESEEPLRAGLDNGIWTVCGTLWCSDGKGGRTNHCVGGAATIKIRQSDGKILSVLHTK
jgi:NTF2 fold immunity protein of polymorphic toxin system component